MTILHELETIKRQRTSIRRATGCTRCGAFLRLCLSLLILLALCDQALAQQTTAAAITGRVLDSSGNPLPDVPILLTGTASRRATSDSAGAFQFSGLMPGHYRLTANASPNAASASIEVAPGRTSRIELRLSRQPSPAKSGPASTPLAQAMQFADDPHFTIAGITDWTAAGGHGSDASLRTSEALTRETRDLQPDMKPSSSASCPQRETALEATADAQPGSFEAHHCLGIFDLRKEKYADAAKNLDAAYRLQPSNAANEYALTEAYRRAGDMTHARQHLRNLSSHGDPADLHRLAGDVDESLGDPVAAVNEFAQAVRLNPSEQNYFAWGSELLYHRAVWQARDVFEEGAHAWPKSPRMLTALGAALFAGALYDDAAQRFCQAADLDPANPEPYLFMGRIEVAAPRPLPCVAQKLADFHRRQPNNALADYYYAMALWKQRQASGNQSTSQRVTDLLHQAITADPGCGEAWLELGNLRAQAGDFASAIPLYAKAVDARPQLTEGYYRLGVAYDRTGQRDKARAAFARHDRLEKEQAAQVEKQRREIKQFVISSAGSNPPAESPHN